MSSEIGVLSGVALTGTLSLLVVLYMRARLRRILVDLCGTAERAEFWTAFSNIVLVLVPMICALFRSPMALIAGTIAGAEAGPVSLQAELIDQVRWALVGLVAALALLGLILGLAIPREERRGAS